MGGKKRPTISQLEKKMRRERGKKSEKSREAKKLTMEVGSTGALTSVSLDNLYEELKKFKVITPYQVATAFKIKIGLAKQALRTLEKQGLLKLIDRNRRVAIYVPVAS
ncbi:MAG: 30S ribosomal protein S25e [Thermoprotei archaeon]|nr:MAG: 30S ribosomal protein S25e [Thermoprotei archaeon]RLE80695.1 MAG: 30S ribosomal protein S25e [Thermoprotei archaeon]RLF00042.1 MAG: 30S ribosomal protein S25e [Thermoprotei archaeon]